MTRAVGAWLRGSGPPLGVAVLVMLTIEAVVRAGWVREYLLPAPTSVLAVLWQDRGELLRATWVTALGAGLGFGIAVAAGMVTGVLMASSRVVERAVYPYAVFFQTVPIIAIAPLLVIWFDYGLPTVVASAAIVALFPVIANTLAGLRSTDPALLDLFRLYGGSRLATLLKLRLPSALPSILTGLKVAAGLAVIGAIVGQFVGGGGLGAVVDASVRAARTEKVFAAVVLASLLGLTLFASLNLLSRVLLRRWHASEKP
ncbi:MAG: ABC transporter permease [Tepidisphaerales bacterium]